MWWICWKPPILGKIKEGHSAKSCKNILQQTTSHNFSDRSTAASFSGLLRIVRTSVMFFTMMENDLGLPPGNKSLTAFVSSRYFLLCKTCGLFLHVHNIYSSLDMYSHMVICIFEPGIYMYVHIHMCVCMLSRYTHVFLSLSPSLPLQARFLPLLGIELKLDLMMAPSRMCLA